MLIVKMDKISTYLIEESNLKILVSFYFLKLEMCLK